MLEPWIFIQNTHHEDETMEKRIEEIIENALREDMPDGDATTDALFTDQTSSAVLIAKDTGVVSGLDAFAAVTGHVDDTLVVRFNFKDGDAVGKGDRLGRIRGLTASILKAERTALNLLQRMSGIATMTRRFVDATREKGCKVYDTRKTAPNLRILDKRAVRDGGGVNHRFSLSDMVLIKDNHISAAGSIELAVELARNHVGASKEIEVEVESVKQFEVALRTDADRIMLDNMDVDTMRTCVKMNNGAKFLEASGTMTLDRVPAVADTGVDAISVGALTHSVTAFDISLRFEEDSHDG